MQAMNKADIVVLGCWEVRNFGSHLTYYALYSVLKEKGWKVLMAGCPQNAAYKSMGLPEYFKDLPYDKTEMCRQFTDRLDMRVLNTYADTFIIGSDQLWYPPLYRYFGNFAFLDFIYEGKKKIAFATSFGHTEWQGEEYERAEIEFLLKRFDAISVRETSGVNICRNLFNVSAEWVLDPVFLCKREIYSLLAEKSYFIPTKKYIAAYILDCDNTKAQHLEAVASKMGCELRILFDPNGNKKLDSKWTVEENFHVEDWIKWIQDSEYVITDSFHGMCVALMLEKNFVVVKNKRRGEARFNDYGKKLGIADRLFDSFLELKTNYDILNSIDYISINSILSKEKARSLEWLYSAVVENKVDTGLSVFDVNSIHNDKQSLTTKENKNKRSMRRFLSHFRNLLK